MRELLDIIQVEDDRLYRSALERMFKDEGLNYLGINCLYELKNTLDSGKTAKLYIIDGNFPRQTDGHEEILAQEAVEMIKSKDNNAKIILFSGDYNLSKTASQLKVGYIEKGKYSSNNLLNEIKKKIFN